MSDTQNTEAEHDVQVRVVIGGGGHRFNDTLTVKSTDRRIGKRFVLVDTPEPANAADPETETAFQALEGDSKDTDTDEGSEGDSKDAGTDEGPAVSGAATPTAPVTGLAGATGGAGRPRSN